MKKIFIDFGHNCIPDTGAVGIKREDDLNRETAFILAQKLKTAGYEVLVFTPSKVFSVENSLHLRCKQSDLWGADLFVSIHHNSFNSKAYGAECFAISQTGRKFAKKIQSRLTNLGFYDRGVKDGSHLFVLRKTQAPAVLVESFFVDSKKDCDLFETLGTKRIAEAIYEGIHLT